MNMQSTQATAKSAAFNVLKEAVSHSTSRSEKFELGMNGNGEQGAA
jgi:hypothetical protein